MKTKRIAVVVGISCLLVLQNPTAGRDPARKHALGKRVYQEYCQGCHGADARGSGQEGLAAHPAPDLTIMARVNGRFPTIKVQHYILGVAEGKEHQFAGAFRREGGASAQAMHTHAVTSYLASLQRDTVVISGGEECYRCRQAIREPRLAATIVRSTGDHLVFGNCACLVVYLNEHPEQRPGKSRKILGNDGRILVADFRTGELIPVTMATFVLEVDQTPSGIPSFVAFRTPSQARARAAENGTGTMDWDGVLASVRAALS